MINLWFCIFIVFIPAVVFVLRPEATTKALVSRVLIGTAIGYALLLIAIFENESHSRAVMEVFYHQAPECADQPCSNTPEVTIDGPAFGVFTYLGWMISALYVGVCECLWRLYYRKTIKRLGTAFRAKRMSNFFAGYALFIWGIVPACMFVSYILLILFS